MKRILLTGPVERLEPWADAARSVGWEPIEFPLIGIEQLGLRPEAMFTHEMRFDWLCVTSRSALPFVERLAAFSPGIARRAACVGEPMTELARDLGFTTPLRPARDAADLAQLVAACATPGASVLWPRGDRAVDLAESLRAHGFVVTDRIVYVSRAVAIASAPQADAVFFASPSACSAWFSSPTRKDSPTLAIAIGDTTFEALTRGEATTFVRITRLAEPTPAAFAFALAHAHE